MTTVLELQPALRGRLREPFGPVATDIGVALASAGSPLVTVGDIVTYHVLEAGCVPGLALVDERTKRATVDDEVSETVADAPFDRVREVENPPATLTADLLAAVVDGLAEGTTLVRVDGEEDLAALPAIAAAPDGASVLYGQPDEGVVHVTVDEVRGRVVDLLGLMDGDSDRAFETLGVDADSPA
ncbi:DUF359 domain-containing protein [Halobacteriales archaeon QH_6_68_27]|nr:MAG: DUF359 domain-containing protein [Halobacteriales archaeon QH_6_68_27]